MKCQIEMGNCKSMESIDYSAQGIVFDIQRFSIHDGPGIRTIVFLKGCPLSCAWCCNPESLKTTPSVMFNRKECIKCGKCLNICEYGAISKENSNLIDQDKCVGCGVCSEICPTKALVLKGKTMTVEQLIKELKKDATVYRRSGGGITISGGEPLMQSCFVKELLKACQSNGWDTAIETTGFGKKEDIIKVLPYVDLVLLDLKAVDREVHKRFTGVFSDLILENAHMISTMAKVVVRVPTVPKVNAFKEEYEKICSFVKTLNNVDTIHMLPYHTYGENKYDLLGKEYRMKDERSLTQEEISSLQSIVESHGLNCVIGG